MKFILFIKELFHEISNDEVFPLASEMTYKTFLSLFPFLLFLTSVLSFFNLDENMLINFASPIVSPRITDLILDIISENRGQRHGTILSLSLIITIYSSSSGFRAFMRGINRAYGLKDTRHFILRVVLSMCLTIIFSVAITLSLVVLIFGDTIKKFIYEILPPFAEIQFTGDFLQLLLTLAVLLIVALSTMLIFKISIDHKTKFKHLYKGAVFTVLMWVLSCSGFNYYINNFSRFGKLYGTIGSVFILVVWINMLVIIMLTGSELNAMFDKGFK